MNQTFITLTKPFAFHGDLLLEKEGKSPISNFFLEKRSKKSANPLYLLGFTGVPPSTNLHLLFGIFLLRKKPLAVIPRCSKYSQELNRG